MKTVGFIMICTLTILLLVGLWRLHSKTITSDHNVARQVKCSFHRVPHIGVERFRILGGQGLEYWGRGGQGEEPNPGRHMASY